MKKFAQILIIVASLSVGFGVLALTPEGEKTLFDSLFDSLWLDFLPVQA